MMLVIVFTDNSLIDSVTLTISRVFFIFTAHKMNFKFHISHSVIFVIPIFHKQIPIDFMHSLHTIHNFIRCTSTKLTSPPHVTLQSTEEHLVKAPTFRNPHRNSCSHYAASQPHKRIVLHYMQPNYHRKLPQNAN